MKAVKYTISVVLLALIASVMLWIPQQANAETITDAVFESRIAELRNTFVHGQYWNYYSSSDYSRSGTYSCYCSGYCAVNCSCSCGQFYYDGVWRAGQCYGYALKLGNLIFGGDPYLWPAHSNANNIVAGDYIRAYFTSAGLHVIFVYKVEGDTVYFTDCNFVGPCQIRWDGTYTKDQIANMSSLQIFHCKDNNCTTGTSSSSAPQFGWIEVKGMLDGTTYANTGAFGTFDVRVNGMLQRDDTNEYNSTYGQHAVSSDYSIEDIKANSGYEYIGANGALSGTISAGANTIVLKFQTKNSSGQTENYTIRNVATNTYLTLDGAVDADTTNFSVASWQNNGSGQVFRLESTAQGYKIIPVCSTAGRVVNPYSDDPVNGTNVNLYHQVGGGDTSQLWKLEWTGNENTYIIFNVMKPTLVLALSGTNVIVADYTGNYDQMWKLVSYTSSPTPTPTPTPTTTIDPATPTPPPEKDRYFGIDVSYSQGSIDWDTVAPNIDFAIIRCGYAEDNPDYDDAWWLTNVSACERLGIPYGVFLYSYMESQADAESEAEHTIRLLAGHHPSLPVYLDLEDAKLTAALSNDQIVQYTNIWLNKVRAAGYNAGVYANYNWWTNRLSGLSLDSKYKWLAAWGSGYESIGKTYGIWQYTNDGSVPGVNGRVDCDYCWNLNAWGGSAPITTYYISYDANGGTGAPASHINAGIISSEQPSRMGYDFLGWSTDPNATVAAYQAGDVCTTGVNHTLYAIWSPKQLTVSFDADGGMAVESIPVTYGETIASLPTPTRKGYSFEGWYNGNVLFTTQTVITQDLLLKAHWSEKQLTMLSLPTALTTIEEEAFAGSVANVIVVPAGVTSIGVRAFADNVNLYSVIVYSSNVTLAANAFENCPNLTIYGYEDTRIHYYAVAKKIPFVALTDGWVLDSEMPSGTTITDEKWTYTETSTSTSSTMSGWEQTGTEWRKTSEGVWTYAEYPAGFSHDHSLYNAHEKAALPAERVDENTKRVAGAASINSYIFWQWAYTDAGYVNEEIHYEEGSDGRYEYHLFHAFETTNSLDHPEYGRKGMTASGVEKEYDNIWSTYHYPEYGQYGPWWWWRLTVYKQNYTDYEKVYIFTRNSESSTEIQPGDGITNVQHWVKYGF